MNRTVTTAEIAQRMGVERDKLLLDRVVRDHVHEVLRACEGNISVAARVLGIYRRTLQRKLQLWRRKEEPHCSIEEPKKRLSRIERIAQMLSNTDSSVVKEILAQELFRSRRLTDRR